MIFTCKKCGSTNYRIETKGTQNGLYCSQCGFWHKWISKEDLHIYDKQSPRTAELPEILIINGIKYKREETI